MTTEVLHRAFAAGRRPHQPPVAVRGVGPIFPGLVGAGALAMADLERFVPDAADDWFDAEGFLGKRGHRYFPRAARLASAAARLALENAGLGETDAAGETCGLIVGTNFGVHRVLAEIESTFGAYGIDGLSPLSAPNFSVNLPASLTGIRTATTGMNITITDPVVAGLNVIVLAHHVLAGGLVRRVLTGAAEDDPDGSRRPLSGTSVVARGAACLFILEAMGESGSGGAIIASLLGRFACSARGEARLADRLAGVAEALTEQVLVSASAISPPLRERLAEIGTRALEATGRSPVTMSSFGDDGSAGTASPLLPLAQAALVRRDAIALAGSPSGAFAAVVLKCSWEDPR